MQLYIGFDAHEQQKIQERQQDILGQVVDMRITKHFHNWRLKIYIMQRTAWNFNLRGLQLHSETIK